MGNLSSLKLVAQRQPSKVSPVVHRRNKLMGKLKDQIALARAAAEGGSFQAQRQLAKAQQANRSFAKPISV